MDASKKPEIAGEQRFSENSNDEYAIRESS